MSVTTGVPSIGPARKRPDRSTERLAKPVNWAYCRLRAIAPAVAVLIATIVVWWIAAKRVSNLVLPRPADTFGYLSSGVLQGQWWGDVGITVLEVVVGFVIGVALGLLMALAFVGSPLLRRAFYPYQIAFIAFPKIAIAPLLIVILGYGLSPKIVIAASLAYFPVLVAAMAGFTEIDPDEVNLMRVMNASRWHRIRYLLGPNAMSYIFPSLDIAIIGALLGAIAGEIVGATGGLGYLLTYYQTFGNTPALFAVLIILGLLGVVMRGVVLGVRRVMPMSIVPKE